MQLSFLQVVRVESAAADWRSMLHSTLAAMVFAAVAAGRTPGLATQHAPLRFGLVALSVGVVMALENDDGEAGAAFRVGPGTRLFARLMPVGLVWAISLTLVLGVSGIPSSYLARLAIEAAVLMTVAILIAGLGTRLWNPRYASSAAMVLVVAFLVSWLLPKDVNPWWAGSEPEPSRMAWYLVGSLCAAGAYLMTRRASLLELTIAKRLRPMRRGETGTRY